MAALPAYDGITLALGDHAVRLRPSLRAAHRLPSPPDLSQHVADLHTGTIRDVILATATDEGKASAFLAALDTLPLVAMRAVVHAPLFTLIAAFNPTADEKPSNAPSGEPMAWPDVVRSLYRRATGWLGWTPGATWNATPAEISEALAGWIEMQTALHGSPDDEDKPADTYTPERLAEIDAQGFDPAFDREGLRALQASAGKPA